MSFLLVLKRLYYDAAITCHCVKDEIDGRKVVTASLASRRIILKLAGTASFCSSQDRQLLCGEFLCYLRSNFNSACIVFNLLLIKNGHA